MTSHWHRIRWKTARWSGVSVTPCLQLWQPRAQGCCSSSGQPQGEQAFLEDLAFPVKCEKPGGHSGEKGRRHLVIHVRSRQIPRLQWNVLIICQPPGEVPAGQREREPWDRPAQVSKKKETEMIEKGQ